MSIEKEQDVLPRMSARRPKPVVVGLLACVLLTSHAGCSVVMATAERLSFGRGWRLYFEVLTGPATPEQINARFERLIRRMPAQYLWGYNRYKSPPGAQPANHSGRPGNGGSESRDASVNMGRQPDLVPKVPNP